MTFILGRLSSMASGSDSKSHLARWMSGAKARLKHAFAVEAEGQPLMPDEVRLLERAADAVVARGMAAPAAVFLESMGPMNFLGSQALHALIPILDVVFPRQDLERIARLLERRDTLTRLAVLIECRSEARRTTPPS
jgi:hypothetical protein